MHAVTQKRVGLVALLGAALGTAVALAAAAGPSPDQAAASSHREAPLIADDPTADNTDLYAFVSPDDSSKVTIIANYIPLEEPAGGPNFNKFGDGVRYNIYVDNDGDARADLTYEFRFDTQIQNPNTFLYNTGRITSLDDPDFNVRQTYRVRRISRVPGIPSAVLGTDIPTPPVNIGPRSTPSYDSLAASAVRTVGGVKVFAGQRDDPFYVDLGSIFDLLGLRPFNPLHLIPLGAAPGVDGVGGFNTHTIALQVPKTELTTSGNAIVGIWAAADRPSIQTLGSRRIRTGGHAVQVSRLGNPLINEVVIPLGDKDYWNSQDPHEDEQFLKYYRSPELAGLVNLLYPPLGNNVPTTNRDDLVAVLLTGVKTPAVNLNFTGDVKADLLRLNTAIAPTAAVGAGDRLGVLNGDLAGFPNGRRLEDDVTDIEIRAVACGYGPVVAGLTGLCNLSPNNLLGDGVDANDGPFLPTFPYVGTPHQGYEHAHHGA